jgi:hypothetical protein
LAWGRDVENYRFDSVHLTQAGRETLKHLSRDPANRGGYMEYLKQAAPLSPVASSYLEEALSTYAANCYKATAVMIGGAAERMALDLRDALEVRIKALGRPVPKKLQDWRAKIVLDAIALELAPHKASMPGDLGERFDAHWPSFTHQIRSARNEAGHPSRIDPVTAELVHGNLLIFPELARMVAQLIAWIAVGYK